MTKIPTNLLQKLSALGLGGALLLSTQVLAPSEGYVEKVYVDPANILTSCFGHTGPELRMGQRFTEAECLNQLVTDLHKHDRAMMTYIKVPVADNVHAAFLSFCYNVGVAACGKSTAIRLLNENKTESACRELRRWVYVGKNILPGLVTRRQKEYELCMGLSHAN
jgi:lysozyme